MKKKRIVPLVLSAAMLVSMATACTNTAENTPSPSVSAGIEDGYIPAPYTADSSQAPTEYLAPVFYQNTDGPTISVTYNGVIVEDGKYFRDSDNDQELEALASKAFTYSRSSWSGSLRTRKPIRHHKYLTPIAVPASSGNIPIRRPAPCSTTP